MAVALSGLLAVALRRLAISLRLAITGGACWCTLPVVLGSLAVTGLPVALRGLLPIALGRGALPVAGLSIALGSAGGVRGRRRRGSIARRRRLRVA